ncbi:MAG: DUF4402 domain-containing protein [Bacteroidales bacterium]|nr:DUF4402 domain-containing protein [Bacteroidales bacterium]
MRFIKNMEFCRMRLILKVLPVIFLFITPGQLNAQEDPPRPVQITVTAQILSFGAFYHGAVGGTVIIDPDDSRSATGDIVLLGMGYSFSSALYEILANPGTIISVLNGDDATLTGDNGGTLTLQIGDSDPLSPFVTTVPYGVITYLNVGGTLLVGNSGANPPGNYTGTFDITLVQE